MLQNIKKIESPNYVPRNHKIQFIILHFTEITLEATIKKFLLPESETSAHYLISKNGDIFQMVKEEFCAWHAGQSAWKNFKNINHYSIGIEIENLGFAKSNSEKKSTKKIKGDEKYWYPYPDIQIRSLFNLCEILQKKYNIPIQNILGHMEIAPDRKIDPGPLFPWHKLIKIKALPFPYNFNHTEALQEYGYYLTNPIEKVISVFQMRYRPSNINGVMDDETKAILYGLTQLNKI